MDTKSGIGTRQKSSLCVHVVKSFLGIISVGGDLCLSGGIKLIKRVSVRHRHYPPWQRSRLESSCVKCSDITSVLMQRATSLARLDQTHGAMSPVTELLPTWSQCGKLQDIFFNICVLTTIGLVSLLFSRLCDPVALQALTILHMQHETSNSIHSRFAWRSMGHLQILGRLSQSPMLRTRKIF